MNIRFWLVFLTFCSLLAPLQAWGAPSPEEVVSRVQAQYDKSGGFKARFRQESRMQAATQGEKAEGLLYFQKPCRMRWQYENPPEQKKEIVADGREVWMFIPQDAVVMVYPLNKVLRSDLVMRFFSGMGELSRDFQISWNRPPQAGDNYVVDLFPRKSEPELKRLTLTINPRTYQLEKLEFTNALGEETRFAFSQMQLNMHLDPGLFTFTPPPGVQVVRENRS
ncbi:MAG: outer membrane lipoprotein carrier protein LolA [Deltaproteobacteria bacterium]|nr:outer membrane lipoprotein carrier protein LolA [Deltaproteobacteria bacterium]MBI4794524.1 outer membrane lipoprotein carrier protein LolA [Deltaproteobacteria bacterium]